jgi:putative redox protein
MATTTTTTTLHHLVGKRFVGVAPDGVRVAIDSEDEHRSGMGPMQLLLNALAACAAMDVVAMIEKRRVTLRDYRVEASGERAETTPRRFVAVHVRHVLDAPGLDARSAQRFVQLAMTKYCSVASSLNVQPTFEVVLEGAGVGDADAAEGAGDDVAPSAIG